MKFTRRTQLFAVLLAAGLLASCATGPSAPSGSSARPKLVVFIAIDGLPQRQVVGYRDQLAPDGFNRFLQRGAWFADAHYGHAYTVTAAGHATMLTGAYPHRTGIIGNDWRDPQTGEMVYCTGDTAHRYIGNETKPLDGTSPKNLKVETVGDVLRRTDARSKVIGISGKDRGAILPAGKTGVAYMYMGGSGEFASSTFYMPAHPAWVNEFNGRKLADRYFKTEWKAVLPDSAYGQSLPDGQAWFRVPGRLPMMMGAANDQRPNAAYYTALLRSPFVDAMSLEFARAAIAGEALGKDDSPDIISISLSGHDYVNHQYSAESRLSHDHFLHLDRMLQDFFRDLDATVGKDNYVAVLTADHGFTPAPETSLQQGRDAGRLSMSATLAKVNAALEQRFSTPKLALYFSASALVVDRKLIAQRGLDADTVIEAARTALLAEPVVVAAYTRKELLARSRAGAPFFDQMTKSWNAERSGDVQYALKPYWLSTSSSSVTSHGSPHPYDTNVPILMWGPAWIKPGRVDTRVEEADVAPTLARLLGIAPPAAAEGKPLPLP